jgi:hypothetical protein
MGWTELVHEAEGIRAVFGGRSPSLETVEIQDVTVEANGQAVRIRFILSEFPDTPPAKWVARGANVVQVELALGNLSLLAISGVLEFGTARIGISGSPTEGFRLTATVGTFQVKAVGEVLWIPRFSAYMRGGSY